ncbi:thermonuclease family protein [Corynebacterium qintianiae]|uniref:thermonuclease family protein n=1 Tax=Corynebacterium qintianiae TaxID=2709392 RepID=UPI0013ECDA01|nr:thermonuclease family protein [Corynebacterium qintianiae]
MGIGKVLGWAGALLATVMVVQAVSAGDPVSVEKIVDGDTLDVRRDGETTRIRLLNVNTPEIGRDGKPSECLAEDARDYLAALLPVGTTVELQFDEEREDKYGRTLAGVFRDGSLVNAEIAREGLGHAVNIAPNDRFYPDVLSAEQEAAAAGKGISTLGPECLVAPQDAEVLNNAQAAHDEATAVIPLLSDLDDDYTFGRAGRVSARLTAVREALRALDSASERQSEFQKGVYGDQLQQDVERLGGDLAKAQRQIDSAIMVEEDRRDEARRAELAEQERQAEEARAAEEQRREAARRESEAARPAPAAPAVPAAPARSGGGGDTYTGCRAYGGNYAFTSVDGKGLRYAKIDCATKAQIG